MGKLYGLRVLLAGLVVICLLIPGNVLAEAEDEAVEVILLDEPVETAEELVDQEWIDDLQDVLLVQEEMYDPAFERYVDLGLLGQAWNEKDPALLTDIALQLAEGERILLRSHKAISADKLCEIAIRTATEKNDKATLARLAKVVEKSGNQNLKTLLSSTTKLAGESRGVDPMTMVSIHKMTPEAYAVYQGIIQEVQAAKISRNQELLKELEQASSDATELSDSQRKYLLKIISEAQAEIPKDVKLDPGIEALDKLGDSSRGWLSSATGGRISTPKAIQSITRPKPKKVNKRTKKTTSRPSGGRIISQPGTIAIQHGFGVPQAPKVNYIKLGDGRIIKTVTGPTGTLMISPRHTMNRR